MDAEEPVSGRLVEASGPRLSTVRTFLFWALALVWFTEMLFLGIEPLSKVWTRLWQVIPPGDPQLVTSLYMTWVVAAPAKGALCVMAVFGLRSKNPAVRTALFVSMALVPPLNIAFPFRQQGFLPGPVAVATVLSSILWGSFLIFREPARRPERGNPEGLRQPSSPREGVLRHVWFAASAATLTLLALLLLFWPRTGLDLLLPWQATLLATHETELFSLVHTGMASGTHLLAVATASWLATINYRRVPALRTPLAAASTVLAGLMLLFPLRRIGLQAGASAAASSILVAFVPLFVGWVLYAVLSYRGGMLRTASLRARTAFPLG